MPPRGQGGLLALSAVVGVGEVGVGVDEVGGGLVVGPELLIDPDQSPRISPPNSSPSWPSPPSVWGPLNGPVDPPDQSSRISPSGPSSCTSGHGPAPRVVLVGTLLLVVVITYVLLGQLTCGCISIPPWGQGEMQSPLACSRGFRGSGFRGRSPCGTPLAPAATAPPAPGAGGRGWWCCCS